MTNPINHDMILLCYIFVRKSQKILLPDMPYKFSRSDRQPPLNDSCHR
jgi:hypothetical protein